MDFDKLKNIFYHDGYVTDYECDGDNISFIIKDGWSNDSYYKFEFKNIKIEVMNNKPELVSYVIDIFSNMNDTSVWLYSGELGEVGDKLYLKLWIRYPSDNINLYSGKSNGLYFNGFNVGLSDDYDDTGCLYIKFIADEINVLDAYPLLKKYSRVTSENLDNLSKFRHILDEKGFKFFSSISLTDYLCTNVELKEGNLVIGYKNIFRSYDKFVLKFIDVFCNDNISNDNLIQVINELSVNGIDTDSIRLIDYKNDETIFGILLSNEQELILNCRNIVFDGNILKVNSLI